MFGAEEVIRRTAATDREAAAGACLNWIERIDADLEKLKRKKADRFRDQRNSFIALRERAVALHQELTS